MMNSEIFLIVLPVFLVIGLGFSLKRTGLVNSEFLFSLNRLIYYVALPALLFYKIATADFLTSFNGPLLTRVVVSALAIIYNAYGESGFAVTGILLGFWVPLLNFLSVVALILPNRRDSYSMGVFLWVKQIGFNLLILASFSGILWSFLALPLPHIIDRALGIVTGRSLPLALISIGASFSFNKLRGDLGVTI